MILNRGLSFISLAVSNEIERVVTIGANLNWRRFRPDWSDDLQMIGGSFSFFELPKKNGVEVSDFLSFKGGSRNFSQGGPNFTQYVETVLPLITSIPRQFSVIVHHIP